MIDERVRIKFWIFISLLIFVLSACQSTPEQSIVEPEESLATDSSIAVATEAVVTEPPPSPEPPTAINTPVDERVREELMTVGDPMPGCTVVSQRPGPDPTVESLFPAVSDADWKSGPETAAVTIVEYGDFQ